MVNLKIIVTKFIDAHQPGWVECEFYDVDNNLHVIREKVPVITTEDLWVDSRYPVPATIACTILNQETTTSGVEIVTIDIDKPYGISAIGGKHVFKVYQSQLVEY